MIQYFTKIDNKLSLVEDDSTQFVKNPIFWINIESPTKEDLAEISHKFNISRRFLESIFDDNEPSKTFGLKSEDSPTMMMLSYPKYTVSPLGYLGYNTFPIAFIIVDQIVITIANHPASCIQNFILHKTALNQIISNPQLFLTHMLWFITHDFVLAMNDISSQMEELEIQLTSATKNEQIYQIMAMQKTLIDFDSSLTQNEDVLTEFDKSDLLASSNEHINKLNRSTLIENKQALSMCHDRSKILDQYSNTVSAVVSNNLNDVMKILTSITIILTIPTIIGGIYGMNVSLPGAQIASAFTWLMIIVIVICLVTRHVLKKHNYM